MNPVVRCSTMSCRQLATYAQQVTLAHGMGHALVCDEHGPHAGDKNGVVSVEHYLSFTATRPAEQPVDDRPPWAQDG